jgi:CheY-like chemotaxis protein
LAPAVRPDDTTAGDWEFAPAGIAPATRPAPAPSPLAAVPAPAPSSPARILIVDDERRIRFAIRVCLETEGYLVEEAGDGCEALDLIIRHAPDLMILDLAMPNLDGMRTLRELQTVHGQLKPRVIMLTAFASMPAATSAIGLGAAAFIEKPVTPDALRQLVAKVLSEPPDAGEENGIPIDWPADGK